MKLKNRLVNRSHNSDYQGLVLTGKGYKEAL